MQRSGRQRDPVGPKIPALVRVDRLGPQALHHLEQLAQPPPPILRSNTERLDLSRAPRPQPQVQAAIAQHIERCRLLGHMQRMPDRRDDNRGAQPDA